MCTQDEHQMKNLRKFLRQSVLKTFDADARLCLCTGRRRQSSVEKVLPKELHLIICICLAPSHKRSTSVGSKVSVVSAEEG